MSELIDNRQHRIRTLEEIIKHLRAGEEPEQVKGRLTALVRECDASEIAAMEQELMAEGVPASEIMGTCDLGASPPSWRRVAEGTSQESGAPNRARTGWAC